jgi:hypothetical protein
VQQQTTNSDGNLVLGQMDFSFTVPINKQIGCAALCGAATYPESIPASEGFVQLASP